MTNKCIAIFGASGEIGSRLTLALLKRQYQVRVFVRSSVGPHLGRLPDGTLDVRRISTHDVNKLTNDLRGVDVVVNAVVDKRPYTTKSEQVKQNHNTTETIVTAAKEAGVKKFIHFSSIVAAPAKLTDEVVSNPEIYSKENDWYTLAKIDSEKVVAQASGEMPYVIIRPGIVYGPGLAWSTLGFLRSRQYTIKLPNLTDSLCHAIHVDDLSDLVISLFARDNTPRLVYGINPEPVSWRDFYQLHGLAIGLEPAIELEDPAVLQAMAVTGGPSFFQKLFIWTIRSPLLAPLINIGFFMRTGAKMLAKVNPAKYIPIPTEKVVRGPLWPALAEIDIYSSSAKISDRDSGQDDVFHYTRPLAIGVKSAAAWWLAKYAESTIDEAQLVETVKTTFSL